MNLEQQHRQLLATIDDDYRQRLTELEDRMDYGDKLVEDHEMCAAVLRDDGTFSSEIRLPTYAPFRERWVRDYRRWDTLLEALVWADVWLEYETSDKSLDNCDAV